MKEGEILQDSGKEQDWPDRVADRWANMQGSVSSDSPGVFG